MPLPILAEYHCSVIRAIVPIPTLPPETETGESLTVELPVNTGTVPEVPTPVTVCAAAPADASAKTNPDARRLVHRPNPSISIVRR
ncbi:MAG: hypothetical protein WBQ94_10515 [Terracidiphilus sp.]